MTTKEKIDQTIKELCLDSAVVSSNTNPDSYDVVFGELNYAYTCGKFATLIKQYTVECICADTAGLGTILVRFSD